MDKDGDLHSAEAAAIAADEVVALGLVEENEILAAAPISGGPLRRAVVVPRLVHLKHVVLRFLVPKRCTTTQISNY